MRGCQERLQAKGYSWTITAAGERLQAGKSGYCISELSSEVGGMCSAGMLVFP